jgi:enoyl-CoA hydratase
MRVSSEVPEAGILVVTIERPTRSNAVDSGTAAELATAFRAFDADPDLSVAILQGRGKTFCGGADLKALAEGDRRELSEEGDGPMGPTRLKLGKPVIAAVEGAAVAGGLELAIWADLRVAATDAVFGVYCRRFGVPLIDLGTIRLPRLVGHGRAMDMILTGRTVHADEALRIGLVDRVVSPGRALEGALELARLVASHPQTCLRNDRLSAIAQWDLDTDQATRNEFRLGRATLESGEALRGAAQFASGVGRHGAPLRPKNPDEE